MSRRAARAAQLATLVVALTSLGLVSPGASLAAGDTCEGVWVVVDARAAGGSLTTSCAPGDPATGLAALEQAGRGYAFVPRIPGMICTIDARPDPCNGAPADAYWSYWYAEAGGSWTYASVGAGSRDPAPGSVEGWRFGDGSAPPGTTPPAPAPDPAPDADPAPAPDPAAAPAPAPAPEVDPTPEPAPPPDAEPDPTPEPGPTPEPDAAPAPTPPAEPTPPVPDSTDPNTAPAEAPSTAAPATSQEPASTIAASGDEAVAPSRPAGPAVATGLLAGIGALTVLQRRRRQGATR